MFHSIVEAVRSGAEEYPERLAVIEEEKEYSYHDFWQMIRLSAGGLRDHGVQAGSCVIAECTQDAFFLACDLACGLLGACFVPVEHKSAPKRVREIEMETEACLLVSDFPYGSTCLRIAYPDLLSGEKLTENDEFPLKGDELAELLFTTGTTGKSKGIMITHDNNIALAQNVIQGVKMRPGNIELVPVPINHAHGIRTVYANLYQGGTVILMDGVMKVKKIHELIRRFQATALDLTPMAASALLKLSKGRFAELAPQLDYIEIGAAALTQELKEKLRGTFPHVRLYNTYGSSESGRTCLLDFSERDYPLCIGRPVPNAEFIITDPDHHPIASSPAHTGLLACRGPMNMKGYWKNPQLTAQIMQDGYLFTNDEGYMDEQGLIYLIGRKDDVINYRGVKIAPEEVEEAASGYPGIRDCCCVPKADPNAGQVPRLFLQLEGSESDFDKKDFMRYLGERLDSNKLPAELLFIDSIPRTYNGKLQRKKLMEC